MLLFGNLTTDATKNTSSYMHTGATQLTDMRRRANSLAAALLYCSAAACCEH